MSEKISKAEEYLKKKFSNTYLEGKGTVINILPKDFYEVMEAYHQSEFKKRVNAISDLLPNELKDNTLEYGFEPMENSLFQKGFERAIKLLKPKL